MSVQMEGVILRGVGGNYTVDVGGAPLRCRAGGRLRLLDAVPAAGDRVLVERSGGQGYIVSLLPRKNALERPAVANLDRLCIFVSAAPPVTDPLLADKMTVAARAQGIEPVLLIAKTDLDRGDLLFDTYTRSGFRVLRVSAVTGEGTEELQEVMREGLTAFAGNSGVGKSSLLNRIAPALSLRVGDMSRIERGKHTTRSAALLPLPRGGYAVDTPGFSLFDAFHDAHIEKMQLPHLFPELDRLFGRCRFSDCLHRAEPDCAVRAAVARGDVARTRYESYLSMLAELEDKPSWM